MYKITIDYTKVSSTLTDFPVYIDLSDMPDSFFEAVTSDGGDIRCYSDEAKTTELPREVVSIDTTAKTGELHVLVSSLSSTADTEFYIEVDGESTEPAVDATYGRNAVWADYAAVYHMGRYDSDDATQFPTSVDDDFTGDDGDEPNSLLWEKKVQSECTFNIQSNTLKLSTTSSAAYTANKVDSNFYLSGDFDVQVDFNATQVTISNLAIIRLQLSFDGSNYIYIQEDFNAQVYYARIMVDGVSIATGVFNTTETSGKFRVARTGSSAYVYYHNGTDWTVLAETTGFITDNVMPILVMYPTAGYVFEAYFDNFTVNSGTIVWPLPDVIDSTGNGNDGTPVGDMTKSNLVDGKLGQGIDFDGVDHAINCGADSSIADIFSGGGTFQCWFNADSYGESVNGRFAQKTTAANDGGFFISFNNTPAMVAFFQTFSTTNGLWRTTTTPSLSTNNKLDIVYDSSSASNDPVAYLNGVPDAFTESTTPVGTADSDAASDLYIGQRGVESDREFDGRLDEIRFYAGILSEDWIAAEYENQNSPSTFYAISFAAQAELNDIVTSSPVLDSLSVYGVAALTGVVTGSPVLDTLTAFTMDITTEVPVIDTLTVTPLGFIDDIVTDSPVLDIMEAFLGGSPIDILTGTPDIGTLTVHKVGQPAEIVAGVPVIDSLTMTVLANVGQISFTLSETEFSAHCGASLEFEVPETQIALAASTENVAEINATIGKSIASFVAMTELVAQIAFDLPASEMIVHTGSAIAFDCPDTTMVATASQEPIVKLRFTTPKTNVSMAAVTQASGEIKFGLPVTTASLVADNQAVTSINAIIPRTKCSMTAVSGSIIELAFNVPETGIAMTGITDVKATIQFDIPKTLMATDVPRSTDDTVLQHVRGAIR